ncbi:MAG: hypothetical protein E7111_03445 [Bacteroidales bacterium]|nr:hypothetical protein [Bacteroidales bacterium]
MNKVFLISLAIVLGLSVAPPSFGQNSDEQSQYVHCILLDNTLSMIGRGGGQDIWADVQNYCYSWVDGIKAPCKVVFFTYAKDLSEPQTIDICSDADRVKVKDAIKNVVIDGRHTWIASNLQKAWNYLCQNYRNDVKKIYLITDGKEEEMNSSMDAVVKDYCAQRGDYDHLYYVDLNGSADPEIFDGPGTSYGKGFCEFFSVTPAFRNINYTLGETIEVEQLFDANGKDVSPFFFEARIESVSKKETNVTIKPAKVSFNNLEKTGDAYKCKFTLDFHNNSAAECDIIVRLVGSSDGENELKIEPSTFCVSVRNRPCGIVIVDGDGWN